MGDSQSSRDGGVATTGVGGAAAYRTILALPRYRRYLTAVLVSCVGDGLGVVAVPWLVFELAPDQIGRWIGLALAAFFLPSLLPVILLGRVQRRLSARTLVLGDAYTRALFLAVIPVLAAADALTVEILIGLLAGSSVLHAWGYAGKLSLVTQLVDRPRLLGANSLLTSSQTLGHNILGPALGGVVVITWGSEIALALDAVSYVALAAGVHLAAGRETPPVPSSERMDRSGLAILLRAGVFPILLAVTTAFYVLYGPFDVALPVYIGDTLEASPAVFGLVETGFGAGAIVGALAAGMIAGRHVITFLTLIIGGWGLAVVAIGISPTPLVAITAITIGGLIYGPYPAVAMTILQTRLDEDQLRSAAPVWAAVVIGTAPISAAALGPTVDIFSAREVLVTSGAATVVLAAVTGAALAAHSRSRAGPDRD